MRLRREVSDGERPSQPSIGAFPATLGQYRRYGSDRGDNVGLPSKFVDAHALA